jgi:hypothetical protein
VLDKHRFCGFVVSGCVILAAVALTVPAAAEEDATSLGDALTTGTFSLNLRYRFESVDQSDSFDGDASASTLRTTLAYRTKDWRGLAAFLELEDVHALGHERSHDNVGAGGLWNGVSDRPVVADPEIAEVNQAYIVATCPRGLRLLAGRQEVTLGNHRFVGHVGWRQNHQSFDAARIDVTALARTTFTYVYVGRVHRIFGDSKPMGTHLLETEHRFAKAGALRAYSYLVDYDRAADFALSTLTLGASFDGAAALGARTRLLYRAELARQSDAGDNPNHVDAGYRRVDLGVASGVLTFKAGYELLGGSSGKGKFTTPLATLHAFNGWADMFLATPADGLEDLSVSLGAKLGSTDLVVAWHDFSADSTSRDLGSELDAQALLTLPWKQKVGLKVALYDAHQHAVDTRKVMIFTTWGF